MAATVDGPPVGPVAVAVPRAIVVNVHGFGTAPAFSRLPAASEPAVMVNVYRVP
jgi:hypothetical protein